VTSRRRTWLIVLLAVVLVGGVGLVVGLTTRDDSLATDPRPTGETGPKGLQKYYTQDLGWEDCAKGRCATVEVPVEYEDPDGETTELRVVVFEAKGKNDRQLFVNPGGPGGSAIGYADYAREEFGKSVRKTYDIVGVDPRGVGKSSPFDCVTEKARIEGAESDPDPDTAAEVEEARTRFTAHGKGCIKDAGSLASHVSTVEAARDLDIVRALVGSKTFDWFGASYGTLVGAAYATFFPDTVGRMVLDGAVDPSLDSVESSFRQTLGFQRALDSYVEDCVDEGDCPLGADTDEAMDEIVGLLDDLEDKPMKTESYRKLTKGLALSGVASALYGKDSWQYLSDALDDALEGDGTALMFMGDSFSSDEVSPAIRCLDNDERGTVADVKAAMPRFAKASRVFGESGAWGAMGCAGWPIKSTHQFPDIDAAGADPILVIGTTRDPATPIEWSEALAEQLGSGVLVTRDGDGHTAYDSGNDCIDDLVDAFLVEGTVPENGRTCKKR